MIALGGAVALLSPLGAPHNWFSGLIIILFGGAVWIGIRQLDFAEFVSASRLFLGGKFWQIIDDETRMADFESSLSQAASIEECWTQIRTGSQSLGFHQVRLNIGGHLFEQACSGPAKPRRQLRIPLPNSQRVNFYRDFDSHPNPLVLSAFVAAVQRGLEARRTAHTTDSTRLRSEPERYQAAAAGASESSKDATLDLRALMLVPERCLRFFGLQSLRISFALVPKSCFSCRPVSCFCQFPNKRLRPFAFFRRSASRQKFV
jgi:hypothetical protein